MSNEPRSRTFLVVGLVVSLIMVPTFPAVGLHVLNGKRYAEMAGDLEKAVILFEQKARITCDANHRPRLAKDGEPAMGTFAHVTTNDGNSNGSQRIWHYVLETPGKDSPCWIFGFQLILVQRHKWGIRMNPKITLDFLNLPDDSVLALWDSLLKERGLDYTLNHTVARE